MMFSEQPSLLVSPCLYENALHIIQMYFLKYIIRLVMSVKKSGGEKKNLGHNSQVWNNNYKLHTRKNYITQPNISNNYARLLWFL